MKIAVCDDEPLILMETKETLDTYIGMRKGYSISIFSNSKDLFIFAQKESLDLVFMDIELKETTGIEAAKELLSLQPDCQIAYLTNYINYALDVYETKHCYYILKSQLSERLPDVMNKVEMQLEMLNEQLVVSNKSEKRVIMVKDIHYIETDKHLARIHTAQGIIETTEKLDDIAGRLNTTAFVRCHKSYFVSLNYVKTYERLKITLKGNEEIPISRTYIKSARETFLYWAKMKHT